MIMQVRAGRTVYIPQGAQLVRASLSQLETTLAQVKSLQPAPFDQHPESFPIVGGGCNETVYQGSDYYTSWCKMQFELVGGECGPDGCENTDILRQFLTVDPGSAPYSSSRVGRTGTYTYIPGDPNFDFIHFEWWSLCYSSFVWCDTSNTVNFFGNSVENYVFDNGGNDLHNDLLTHGFILWANFTPLDESREAPGRTQSAYCLPESADTNQCLYALTGSGLRHLQASHTHP
jgi:hypothetical protein